MERSNNYNRRNGARGGGGRGRGDNSGDGGPGGRSGYGTRREGRAGAGGNYGGRGGGHGRGGIEVRTNPPSNQSWGYRPAAVGQGEPQGQPSLVVGQGVGPTGGRGAWSAGPPPPTNNVAAGRGSWANVLAGSGGTGVRAGAGAGASSADSVQFQKKDPESLPDLKKLQISDDPSRSLATSMGNKLQPIKRPDRGTCAVRQTRLLANHFLVKINPEVTILHYDVDVKPTDTRGSHSVKKLVPKSDLSLIREKLFSDWANKFPMHKTAFDGLKNIYSAVVLPTEPFKVELSNGDGPRSRAYTFTLKLVSELKLSKFDDYVAAKLMCMPRDALQAMDVIMKENPTIHRISVGRNTYSREFGSEDDLGCGVVASKGFQQSTKVTSQGPVLCLDYSVLPFHKPLPVIDFLKEHIRGFSRVNDITRMKAHVTNALKGLKVNVIHRVTKQKYTIAGLTSQNTRDLSFSLDDSEGKEPSRKVSLINYFKQKYGKDIVHIDIPCLDVGKNGRQNHVPMEFCILVEGQRYPKENLDRNASTSLKRISVADPEDRKNTICEMIMAQDAPCGGDVIDNFGIGVEKNMTSVLGRVLQPPALKLATSDGRPKSIKVDGEKCHWNLVGNSMVDAKPLERWALIDFSSKDRYKSLDGKKFVQNLRSRCGKLGMRAEDPVTYECSEMSAFTDVNKLKDLLFKVTEAARKKNFRLQIVVCVMTERHPGYKHLKWVSETQVGVVTQCCLSDHANSGKDQYLANLAMKINAKLGGCNVELIGRLPHFQSVDHVMFIGADVNHPGALNVTCPSIAAVVGTVNWPAATRYAARVCPQNHRKEKIVNFGAMCSDLVNTYAELNKVKPKKIVVFRDGVSEGQFDMVLNEELQDLKAAICDEHYKPTITLVVAQKRHHTRLFLEDQGGDRRRNLSPGTVVDTKIVHPFEFDFYLCSHYGNLGTSKPTHYYVLWDENKFTSDDLQNLIYQLCFTFARCTKPVSLVPPVYYADLVAYRGRMFQEVVMELHGSSALPSTSGASFDDNLYKLHQEVEKVMFFV